MYDTGDKISFGDLKTELKALIWPNGVPENLVSAIDAYFEDALMDLQRWVTCLQAWHTDVFPQCATYFRCGLTVLDAPRGKIRRVRTFQDAFCDPVTMVASTPQEVYCWSRKFIDRIDAPANAGLPALPAGFKFADASTDSQFGRAQTGLWTMDRAKLYVAPWIQSRESVVVEWDGMKRKFSDADLWPDERDLKRAIKLFVQEEFSRDFERDFGAKKVIGDDYATAKADLMWQCASEMAMPKQEHCKAEREYLWEHRLEDDSPANADQTTSLAVIGEFGSNDANEQAVSILVKGWLPSAIVTLGENGFLSGTATTYDNSVGKYYRLFIHPYGGSEPLGPGELDATVNKFWPCLGPLDNDHLSAFQSYFAALNNQTHYDQVLGHCHFFFLNCGRDTSGEDTEPTGNTILSMQAGWLRVRIAQSTSRWKIVVVNMPPVYNPFLAWDFQAMGSHLVLSALHHNYERYVFGGLPHIICGSSGAPLQSITPQSGQQFGDSTRFGALQIVATCAKLTAQFFAVDGTVLDAVDIT